MASFAFINHSLTTEKIAKRVKFSGICIVFQKYSFSCNGTLIPVVRPVYEENYFWMFSPRHAFFLLGVWKAIPAHTAAKSMGIPPGVYRRYGAAAHTVGGAPQYEKSR
jgi:hypothetical protein